LLVYSDATMDIAISMRKDYGIVTNMHLTCTNIEAEKVTAALEQAKEAGIRNIVALRGDAPEGQDKWETTSGGFGCAADLVGYIRKNFGQEFCISVAGYPEGHPDKIKEVVGGKAALSESELTRYSTQTNEDGSETVYVCSDADFAQEMQYLKAKVDAGADFVITQMFFDVEVCLLEFGMLWLAMLSISVCYLEKHRCYSSRFITSIRCHRCTGSS